MADNNTNKQQHIYEIIENKVIDKCVRWLRNYAQEVDPKMSAHISAFREYMHEED